MTFTDVAVFHALDNWPVSADMSDGNWNIPTPKGDYVGLFRVVGEEKLLQINTDGPKVSAKMLRDIERDWFDNDLKLFAFEEWDTWPVETDALKPADNIASGLER
jgi:hypothetical protein